MENQTQAHNSRLTQASLDTFLKYAIDPLTVKMVVVQRGDLTDLVKRGLIVIRDHENPGGPPVTALEAKGRPGDMYVIFTDAGKCRARVHGIELDIY
tara:strand:- start:2317 stop:2607 length:291 start_codon:yes stop_codon:yes gene_type:complete